MRSPEFRTHAERIARRKKPILHKSCELKNPFMWGCLFPLWTESFKKKLALLHFTAETTVRIEYLKDNVWLAVIRPIAKRMDTKPQPVQHEPYTAPGHQGTQQMQQRADVVCLFLDFNLSCAALRFLSIMDSKKYTASAGCLVTKIWWKCASTW